MALFVIHFQVFNSVYWVGFIYLLWPLAMPFVKKAFPPKITKPAEAKPEEKKEQTTSPATS